jgi:hypothetical protein
MTATVALYARAAIVQGQHCAAGAGFTPADQLVAGQAMTVGDLLGGLSSVTMSSLDSIGSDTLQGLAMDEDAAIGQGGGSLDERGGMQGPVGGDEPPPGRASWSSPTARQRRIWFAVSPIV